MSTSSPATSGPQAPKGPPYAPTTALLGLIPTVKVDVPICAVLMVFFLSGFVLNLTIFRRNKARGHKFLPSVLLAGFCMARNAALVLRIAWSTHHNNARLTIAATILAAAGVIILFIVNLIFTQRLVRSIHPHFGWGRIPSLAFKALYAYVIICLIMTITITIISFYTRNPSTLHTARIIQLLSGTSLAALAFLPIPILIATLLAPRRSLHEPFGKGSLRTKLILVFFTATLLSLGAGFRVGVSYTTPRPASDPAWYHQKACYYVFNYVIELIVVYTYALNRCDRRFHIPNGSSAPGHYSAGVKETKRSSSTTNINDLEAERSPSYKESFGIENSP
ncbi:hypothetical protein CORC01_12441 [Colletotrichum orchidophilum]|uniref:Family c-likeg-protein-coupled receptor protein n=1 Tax=Colletotrichum orchidophilum TaxID=1209926 RepID=A0A1G4AT95_9PEZI|nr:uncharacterized protein CORC01_12441 [Colletotrichum orchidophilum]OHE92272.1 hypothetical protein CORC01_12441 [Colletotrichum orchidophilum]